MCYSASASFTTSAVLLGVGITTLFRIRTKNEVLLALIPLFFSFQQFIEGWLWVNATWWNNINLNILLSYVFLFFAYVFWPIMIPLASFFLESNALRRKIIFSLFIVGSFVALFCLFYVISPPHPSEIIGHSIYYHVQIPGARYFWSTLYVIATCFSFLISSYRTIQIIGLMWLIALIFTLAIQFVWFTSVWCFWGAVLSLLIYFHFSRKKKYAPLFHKNK